MYNKIIKKLNIVSSYSEESLKNKISIIVQKLADKVTPESVGIPDTTDLEEETPVTLLQENMDNFSLLLRTLDTNDELIKDIKTFDSITHKLQSIIQDIVNGMREILKIKEEDELPEGDLNEFINSFETHDKEFIMDLVELSSLMKDSIKEIKKDKKSEPVEHKLNKIKLGPKKEEKEPTEEKEISEEDINETVKQLNELNL